MKIVKTILKGLGVLIGIIIIYLIVIIFSPVLSVPEQPIARQIEIKTPPAYRQDVSFSVDETKIDAWLYLPRDVSQAAPCVILSQGFGGTKDCGVCERYAVRFVEAGFAALTYDFRHFGKSEGEPRQLFDQILQLEDLRAAIDYARSRKEIDAEKIFLWCTSASGGYGLVIAAEDKKIAGVIAQCASIDHEADSKMFLEREGIGFIFRLIPHAQRDKGRSRFGLSPHKIPIVGKPKTIAILNAPGAFDGYSRLLQDSETFENEVCARLFLTEHGPDPVETSKRVECPVLFLVCEKDNLVSPDSHKRAAQALGDKARVKLYPIGHFDIYVGEHFDRAVDEMIMFLKTNN